jgi:hypothetical protein
MRVYARMNARYCPWRWVKVAFVSELPCLPIHTRRSPRRFGNLGLQVRPANVVKAPRTPHMST